jgi:3D-(3,5/4)-trihydroxycyclohexane-1,2-dione acylhydrolase (decyclizing)
MGTGGAEFNNLYAHARGGAGVSIDFRAHAASMGATAVKVGSIAELESALASRHAAPGPFVAVIDTTPYHDHPVGGTWWEVGVPAVSTRPEVTEKHGAYVAAKQKQALT